MENKSATISQTQERFNGILKNVYLWMTAALALTAVVAWYVGTNTTILKAIYSSGFSVVMLIVVQFALVAILTGRINVMSTSSAVLSFIGYSVCTGITMSSVFAIYTGQLIFQAFAVAAAGFAGAAVYALFSGRNMNRMGTYLSMGLGGLIVLSIIGMFVRSNSFQMIVSIIGVVMFICLTAWDTKKISLLNDRFGDGIDEDTYVKISILGALSLYLDFINLFLYVIRILSLSGKNRK